MCALFGWLNCGKKVPYKVLKKLTQALANEAEERGTDASGISYIYNGEVVIYKRPKPAHKVRFNFPEGTTAIMGHTRMTTQGDAKKNYNNHPFLGKADKKFAFAHNGVLYNDGILRLRKNLPETKIETDSYVAVQLIEKEGFLDHESLGSMAEDVQGNFVFTALDEKNTLYFVKGSNPLTIAYLDVFDLYVYASTDSILFKALNSVGLKRSYFSEVIIDEGDIISINSEGKMKKTRFNYSDYYSHRYRSYYDLDVENIQEEWLLETCSCFGVDEDDVMMLLDYGYTADEIEEMFMDDTLLHSCLAEIHSMYEQEDMCELCI